MTKNNEIIVDMDYFTKPVKLAKVKDIVFRKLQKENVFIIGFLPGSEFSYTINNNPDVYFNNLEIKEVYYEPYRTFIRLKKQSAVEISFPGVGDKLYVKGINKHIPVHAHKST